MLRRKIGQKLQKTRNFFQILILLRKQARGGGRAHVKTRRAQFERSTISVNFVRSFFLSDQDGKHFKENWSRSNAPRSNTLKLRADRNKSGNMAIASASHSITFFLHFYSRASQPVYFPKKRSGRHPQRAQ